jgi:hypothetical protein
MPVMNNPFPWRKPSMKCKLKPQQLSVLTFLLFSSGSIAQAQLPNPQQIAALRQEISQTGNAPFDTFLQTHNISPDRLPNAETRAALDSLCQQRDCHASRLYWYTDLEQAKAAAQKSGKPILSLRMLGQLDQDLSCANSRFFRVALYPNGEISQKLRDKFILHWSSERPVPKLTLDFGDGRKLERTVTGNSIHYVLDANGMPIEALPGLYSPQAFLQQLTTIESMYSGYKKQSNLGKFQFLSDYHRDRLTQIQTKWSSELKQAGLEKMPRLVEIPATDAATAGRVAMSKMVVEMPIVRALRAINTNQTALTQITDEAAWKKLAMNVPSQLDTNSLSLMQRKLDPNATATLTDIAQQFQQNMALDTVRNEYLLHSQIHQWFMGGSIQDFTTLNQRVYSQLFLTPKSDPWLGLNPQDSFAAIEQNGILR